MIRILIALAVSFGVLIADGAVLAQPPARNRRPPWYIEPTPQTRRKIQDLIGEVHEVELSIDVQPNVSRLIRTKVPIQRFAITDPRVLDVIVYSPTEFELVGLRPGVTSLTLWYTPKKDAAPARRDPAKKVLRLQR